MKTNAVRQAAVLFALLPGLSGISVPAIALSSMPTGTAKPVMPDAEKTIRGFYASVANIAKVGDVKAFARLFELTTTNDWTSTGPSEYILTRAKQIEFLHQHPKEMIAHFSRKGVAYSLIFTRVKIDGDRAVVDAVLRETNPALDAVLQSNTGPTGRTQHRAKLTPTHDTWVKQAGVWKLQHSKILADRFEIDGKIVKP